MGSVSISFCMLWMLFVKEAFNGAKILHWALTSEIHLVQQFMTHEKKVIKW